MKEPRFLRTGKINLVLKRFPNPTYVKGKLVQPPPALLTVRANVQPATKQSGQMFLPEEAKTKKGLFLWSISEIRQKVDHGTTKHQADRFTYEGEEFEVVKVIRYKMGILDHYEALALFVNPAEIVEPNVNKVMANATVTSTAQVPE